MTILDAHVHVWDPERIPHPWLADVPPLNRAFLPRDIDTAGGRIGEWIFVETDADPASARVEVEWVAGLDWPGLRGIVAHVAMARGDLGQQLGLVAADPRVVGVRPSLQNGSAAALEEPEFARDLARIGAEGLAFDACVRWQQLDALVAAVERAPQTTVVLDHLGKPPVLDGTDSDAGRRWRGSIERLASFPRTFLKCSGIPAESGADGFAGVAGEFERIALDAFGAERAMFGGDWPVSGLPFAGVPVAAALDALRAVCSGAEWAQLAGETARRVYLNI